MTDIHVLNDILFMRMLHLVYLITSFFVSRVVVSRGLGTKVVVIKRARHEICRYHEGSLRELSFSRRLVTRSVVTTFE